MTSVKQTLQQHDLSTTELSEFLHGVGELVRIDVGIDAGIDVELIVFVLIVWSQLLV